MADLAEDDTKLDQLLQKHKDVPQVNGVAEEDGYSKIGKD